ncbi:hypothetical protein [Limnobacter sp.]|jgi:hypothetical protein|uniref:hypothetical protein n=1 Tax=Limnobacter sp. TaxID=2003368 RepID=UPI0039C98A3B
MKKREILTYPLSKEQFWEEFRHFVAYFLNRGISECSVLFGFDWGNEYYPGEDWIPETIKLEELEAKILELESRGLGEFGYNDIFIELAQVEFRFCNDTDIHIGFDRHQPLIKEFYSRWEALGYCPAEWLTSENHGPGECVRGGKNNA